MRYKITHNNKTYLVNAPDENTAISKIRMSIQSKEFTDSSIKDDIGSIAKMLGGVAIAALESKKLLQSSSTPSISESVAKTVGVLGTDLIGIGSELARFAKNNSTIGFKK